MGVDAWLPWRDAVPLDLPFSPPPRRVVERPPHCPVALSSPSPARGYPSRTCRTRHSAPLSRVTLYLFKAPSDRPSAACTESTWRFRWDLNARRGFGRSAHPRVSKGGEREGECRPLSRSSTGRFSISAGFVSVRVTAARRRDFHVSAAGSQQADYASGHPPPLARNLAHLVETITPRSPRSRPVLLQRHSATPSRGFKLWHLKVPRWWLKNNLGGLRWPVVIDRN